MNAPTSQQPTCLNHPDTPAAGACASCQNAFCASCLTTLMGYPVCGRCKEWRSAQMQATQQGSTGAQGPPTLADHLIPVKNPPALIAYYLGVASLIPCLGNFLGPAAILLGVRGLRARRENRNLPGQGHAIAGIVLGVITTLFYWGVAVVIFVSANATR